MTSFVLSQPITLANQAVIGKVEITPLRGSHLAKVGDEIRTVTNFIIAAGEASKRGEIPTPAGSDDYRAMLVLIKELTTLGDDADQIFAEDIDGLVAAILYGSAEDVGNS